MVLNSIATAAVTNWDSSTGATNVSGSEILSWDVSSSGMTWTSGTAESIIWTMDVSDFDASKTYSLLCIDDFLNSSKNYYGLSSVYIENGTLYLQSYAYGATVASTSLANIYTPQSTQNLTFVWSRSASNQISLTTYADYAFDTPTSTLNLGDKDKYDACNFTSLDFGGKKATLTHATNDSNFPTNTEAAEWTIIGAGYTSGSTATTAELNAYALTQPYVSQRTDDTSIGRVTFIGDSITHGVNDQSYRWQFFKILEDNGIENQIVGPRNGYYNIPTNTSDAGTTYGDSTFSNVHLAHASGRTRNIIAGGQIRDDFTSSTGVDYSGWSSSETGDAYNSDSWFCMIGTNDILSDTGSGNGYAASAYCNRMTALLGGAVTFEGDTSTNIGSYTWTQGENWGNLGTIVSDVCTEGDTFYMLSIIPWGTHNHNYDSDHLAVQEYNRNLKQWCASYTQATGTNVKYVDVTRGMVDVTGGQIDGKITDSNPNGIRFYAPDSFFNGPGDRLHPNEQGSLIMAGNLAQAMQIGGRTAGLSRRGTEGWTSAQPGTITAGERALLLGENAFTMSNGYTVDLSAAFGNGRIDGWMSIDNTLSISLGDGTHSGTLNLSEGYIMWGSDVLFCWDNSTLADEGNLRIAWHNGNTTDNVLQGYYVWLGDMLIGQGLESNSESMGLNGILLSASGADATINNLAWTDTAYAPTLPQNWLYSSENAYVTTQDTANVTSLRENVFLSNLEKMNAADRNNEATTSNIDYTGSIVKESFTGANTSTSHLVTSSNAQDSKFILKATTQWISITNTTPANDVSVQLKGAAKGTIFGAFSSNANAGILTLEIEEGSSVADGTYDKQTAAIAGSYNGGKAEMFNVYVNGGSVNGDIVGGSIYSTGKIKNVNITINSGTVKNIIGGAKIANAIVDTANIRVNGGVVDGNITAGGTTGAGSVAAANITITGGQILGDIKKGSATTANVTVEGNKAYIRGSIEADKVILKNIESSGYSDGFDRYAGAVTAPSLELNNVQTDLVLRLDTLLNLSVTGRSNASLILGESVELQSLTLDDACTFSAWKEHNNVGSASNESTITIGELTTGTGATLNANIIFTEGSILTMNGSLAMGSSIILSTGMSLTLSDTMLNDLYSGSAVNLFTGVDSLTLNGINIDYGTILTENIFTGLSNDFSYNLCYAADGTVSLSTIPEPTTATLSLLALASLAARRRRR